MNCSFDGFFSALNTNFKMCRNILWPGWACASYCSFHFQCTYQLSLEGVSHQIQLIIRVILKMVFDVKMFVVSYITIIYMLFVSDYVKLRRKVILFGMLQKYNVGLKSDRCMACQIAWPDSELCLGTSEVQVSCVH